MDFDKACAMELLQSVNPFLEERGPSKHSWAVPHNAPYSHPLLRICGEYSGSEPDDSHRMKARLPRERLGSRESRKKYLAIHADYRNWVETPFISFWASKSSLDKFLSRQSGRNFPKTLTVINPNVRIVRGLPMVEMESEMKYYDVEDPYDNAYYYYRDEYLCLWEVTPDEVVGHLDWDIISKDDDWYQKEILPAFKEHDNDFFRRSPVEPAFDMSALQSALPRVLSSSVNRDPTSGSDMNLSSQSDPSYNKDWDSSHEGWDSSNEESSQFEDDAYWDTDDEVEESNAIDDAYKGD